MARKIEVFQFWAFRINNTSIMSEHQDWQTVTLRGKKNSHGQRQIEERRPVTAEVHKFRKLDSDADVRPTKKRLTAESRIGLSQARIANKKTQRDVEKELAFPTNSIRDFEAGTVVPTGAQISALHRYFTGAKLVLKTETY